METNKVVSPYLRVFEPPDEDDSITEFEYIEYLPNDSSNMDKEGYHNIETRDLDEYLLPHKAVLEVRGRLVKENGTNYANTDANTITNNGWSLFRSLQYQIDNKIVEDVDQYLPQASTIMNLVQFSDDYSRSTATNMFWYRDTSTGAADLNEFGTAGVALLPAADPGGGDLAFAGDDDAVTGAKFRALKFANKLKSSSYNMGFRIRQLITMGNKSIAMLLPLSAVLGSHRDIDTVMRGMKHTYIMRRNSPDNYIHRTAAAAAGKFKIEHLAVWIPKLRLSLSVQTELEALLLSGAQRTLYFEQMRVYRSQFGHAETCPVWRVTSVASEQLPRHVFIAFANVARDGNQTQNNQVFDHANLARLAVLVNSQQYPEREIFTNFTAASRNYSRAYMLFLKASEKYSNPDPGSQVPLEDFANLYPIIHVDVSKHRDKLKIGTADIEVRWHLSADPGWDYHVYCVVLSDRFITLEAVSGRMNVIL